MLFAIASKEGVTKGSEKKGTTKSFSFPLCSSWFKAFMLSTQLPARVLIHHLQAGAGVPRAGQGLASQSRF